MKLFNFFSKWFLRLFMPKEARLMESDGAMAQSSMKGKLSDAEDYVFIDDKGADVTVFAFSGLDALFAGQARFEFRGVFDRLGHPCNLVCFRDSRRVGFYIAPDGTKTGLDFFTNKTRELMKSLGATHNVTLGASAGGQAAFIVGTRCGVDKIIAFSPCFPTSYLTSPRSIIRTAFNFRALFFEPKAYLELAIVTSVALFVELVHGKKFDWDRERPLREYEGAGDDRPDATLFYGERSRPDRRQAEAMQRFPQVKLRPVPTGRHNAPVALKERGEMASALTVELAFDSHDYARNGTYGAPQEAKNPIER